MIWLLHPDAEQIRRILSDLGLDVAVDTGPKAGLEAVIETPKGQFRLV